MPAPTYPVLMFAAGFGTRMKDLTKDKPKPLITVACKPLVDHALALARDVDCAPIIANLHYKAELLEAHLAPQGVQTIVEMPQILETGGGLRNALSLLGKSPVITMNTDAIWVGPNPVAQLIAGWRPDEMDALLICIPKESAVGHEGNGDFMLSESGRIERGPGAVYGGVQIIKTDLLHEIKKEKFSLNLLWDKMLATGRMYGLHYQGKWCDVGHPAGIKMAENMLKMHDV
ncbi:NTP transferase domain-containing protein [Sulfitobacter sp. JBTF-M27]|uniref:NTP transferase domain-containing protein n=1 Tax=Sulfitobacter sediminilitoris TaxID=2698830 RepID=A0A6P0CAZ6_9RHOB|nr:nucleotidyltransferase family protein [Sulfitobacter sediminilitoris]NEK21524.1 NTP transferase domain-containing protein [Sulfitobacter sediminilitoris]